MKRRITPSQVSLMKAVFCFTRAFNSKLLAGLQATTFPFHFICAVLFFLHSFLSLFFLLSVSLLLLPELLLLPIIPPLSDVTIFLLLLQLRSSLFFDSFFCVCLCVLCCRRPFNSFYLALVTSLRYCTYPPTLSLFSL